MGLAFLGGRGLEKIGLIGKCRNLVKNPGLKSHPKPQQNIELQKAQRTQSFFALFFTIRLLNQLTNLLPSFEGFYRVFQ